MKKVKEREIVKKSSFSRSFTFFHADLDARKLVKIRNSHDLLEMEQQQWNKNSVVQVRNLFSKILVLQSHFLKQLQLITHLRKNRLLAACVS